MSSFIFTIILTFLSIFKHGSLIRCDQDNDVHRYRFKHAFDEIIRSDGKDNDVLKEANAKVCRAIKGHEKAIELVSWHIR